MKFVIYTCIVGSYDELLQPEVTDTNFDFVCFVGSGEKTKEKIGVWSIRELDCGLQNPRIMARYAKTHPHVLLPEYDVSVWIDGNVKIMDGTLYEATKKKAETPALFSGVTHPERDNVYDEVTTCASEPFNYLTERDAKRIKWWLFFHGLPKKSGLLESNLMFRRHMKPKIIRFDELWWKRINDLSFRDQLSQMWCLKKCKIPVDYLLPEGLSTRNHPGFKYLLHKK